MSFNHRFKMGLLVLSFFCLGMVENIKAQNGWVNEIHYQNTGPDQGEFLEVMLENISSFPGENWSVYLYNGQTGLLQSTHPLSGFNAPLPLGTFSLFTKEISGLADEKLGIALGYNGQLVQFISYGGVVSATEGIASGKSSVSIGQKEDETTGEGQSLQLKGNGSQYYHFHWEGPFTSSKGQTNAGQSLQVSNRSSLLENKSTAAVESAAIEPFEYMTFVLKDVGGDGLNTSLTRLVMEVNSQTVGLSNEEGHRLQNFLSSFRVRNKTTGVDLAISSIEFPDYQTMHLYFEEGTLSVGEAGSAEFSLFAGVKPSASLEDKSTLSLRTRIQDFQTGPSSSRLAENQLSLTASTLTFNIKATAFIFENEPPIVIGDRPSDGVEEGQEFSVTIKAVDANGRWDTDFEDELTLDLKNSADGRSLRGHDNHIYPSMTGGVVTSTGLIYSSSSLPESFRLVVNGSMIPGNPVPVFESSELQATVVQDHSSIVTLVSGSGAANIPYANYQDSLNLTIDNSLKLGSFTFSDSPESGASDGLDTKITAIKIQLSNPENLQSLALFKDDALLAEHTVRLHAGGLVGFNGLNINIPDNGSINLDVRATFQDIVADNSKIAVEIFQVVADPSGSKFDSENPAGVIIGNLDSDDVNRLEVTATELNFLSVPAKAVENSPVKLLLEAVDALGNRDLDETSSIEFTKASGPGSLTPESFTSSLVEGFLQTEALQFSGAGLYNLKVADVDGTGQALSSATSATFQVYALCSCEGLLITEIAHGTNSGSPKYLEISNTSSNTYKLESLELRVYEDGSSTANQVIKFPSGASLSPGGTYIISNTAFNSSWGGAFANASPDLIHAGMVGNGNDVYELYNPAFQLDVDANIIDKILDVYGEKGINGKDKEWEYTQKLLNRKRTITAGNAGTFSMADWTILSYANNLANPGSSPGVDGTGPAFQSASPTSGAEDVNETSDFAFTFNEVLNFETGQLHIRRVDDQSSVFSTDLLNKTLISGEGTTTLTVQPDITLPGITEFYVEIEAGAVTDLVGNPITGFSYPFKTTDTIKPTVVSLNPADNSTNAVLNPVFRIEFSEPVLRGTGSFKLVEVKGAGEESLVGGIEVSSDVVKHPQPHIIEFELPNSLLRLQDYYILADEGILLDKGGNAFAGFSGKDAWSFKTLDPYQDHPKIVKRDPANQEGYVLPTHQPKLFFNKTVVPGKGAVSLYNRSTGQLVKSIKVEKGKEFTLTGAQVAFNFGTLAYQTTYSIQIEEGSFTDQEGRSIDKFHADSEWTFTTLENADPLLVVESTEDPLYFGNVPANGTPATKVYKLGGRNLTQNVTLEIPQPFQVSLDGGNTYLPTSISLTPGDLVGFKDIVVRFAPKTANGQLYQVDLLHSSPEIEGVKLGLLGREGAQPQTISIAEARSLGAGAEVILSGVVTTGSSFGNNFRYLQDATGAIMIYSSNTDKLAAVQKGDKLKVSGSLLMSAGQQLQMGGEKLEIEKLGQNVPLPEPKQVYAKQMDEPLESQLILLGNLQFEKAGDQFEAGKTYLFTDTRGNQGMLKIEGAGNPLVKTIIPAVASVTGVLAQENSYYLLARDLADVELKEPLISLSYPDGKMNFGFVKAGENSSLRRITVTVQDLAEDVTISVPAPFQLSANSVHFSQSLQLSGSGSIWVRFSPQESNGAIYQEEVSFTSSSAPEVKAPVAGVEGVRPDLLTIAEARIMPLGEKVKVKGLVSSGKTISYHQLYFQDATAGIVVSLLGDQTFSELPIGAEIQVEGILQESNGLLQLGNNPKWELLNEAAGEPQPLLVNAQDFTEKNEARLVKIQNLQIVEGGTFKAGKAYHFLFPSGEEGLLEIPEGNHPLAGLRIPYKATITGVLSESAEGYLLIPRLAEDLEALDAIVSTTFPEGEMKFLFVPAGSNLVKSFKMSGERLQGNISLSTNAPFEISTNNVSFGRSANIAQIKASDVTIYVRYRPTLAGSGVSEDFVVINTPNARPVQVSLIGIEGKRPDILPIVQARALGAGETVKIQGILSSGSGWFEGKRFVQDETGGLVIVAASTVLAGFELGDKVEVSGLLEEEDNLLQITGDVQIRMKEAKAGEPGARTITSAEHLNESNESELLALNSIRFTSAGFFEKGKPYAILLENGEEARLRISGDKNSLIGKLIPGEAHVKAILVQMGEEYELLPRNHSDLEVTRNAKAILLAVAENGFDFGLVQDGTASYKEQYFISGQSIDGKIKVSVEEPFQLSIDGTNWVQQFELSGTVDQTPVYVRFNPAEGKNQWFFAEIIHAADEVEARLPVRGQTGTVVAEVKGPNFAESFDQCFDLNSFTRYDADGFEQWSCAEGWGAGQSGAVGIHHLGTEAEANDDWLISPSIMITSGSRMAMDIARKHAGPELEVLVSTDYSGSGNPAAASWKALVVPLPAGGESLSAFETIQDINLSNYAGQNVYVAFHYQSTYEAASAYLLDNFSIESKPSVGFAEAHQTLQEGNSREVRILLSSAAKQSGTVSLRFSNGEELKYGEEADYITTPALNPAGELVLEVAQGQEEISFSLLAREDLREEGDEQLIVQLLAVSNGLVMDQEANETSFIFKSNNAQEMSIATAREVNEEGAMVHQEKLVKLRGIAYGPNLSLPAGGLEFRLMDHDAESPVGIVVSHQNASSVSYSLQEGDELEIAGVLRNEEGLAVLEPQVVSVLKRGISLLDPLKVGELNESTESQLLLLDQVEVKSGWLSNPTSTFNVQVQDEEGKEFTIQIRPGTDLYGSEQPAGKISIVGFGGQQDASQPFTGGYYLLPRSKADLKKPTGIDQVQESILLTIFPNPASSQFFIRSTESARFERVQIISYNGKLLLDEAFEEGKALDAGKMPNGMYLVKVVLKGGNFTMSRLSVIR